MKKLIVTLVVMLSMVISLSGCGPEDCSCEDPLQAFFTEYYIECIQLCTVCSNLASQCNISNYSIENCVADRWYEGASNFHCLDFINQINTEWLETEDCMTGHIPNRCSF